MNYLLAFCVFFFAFHFFLAMTSPGYKHIKYAVKVGEFEGWWKVPYFFYASHFFSKKEIMYMNTHNNEAKYSSIILSNIDAACRATLNDHTTRMGQPFIEFHEDGTVDFKNSELYNTFSITPLLISSHINGEPYIIPPRIVFMLRKVYKKIGKVKPKTNSFDNRKTK